MGSRSKPKIEVPRPTVYQTRVPDKDFKRGFDNLKGTRERIRELQEEERLTLGNRKYRGYQDAVNRFQEAASYAASIPADQKSYAMMYGSEGKKGEPTRVPFQSQTIEQSGFDPEAIGGEGIGQKDLTYLREQGFNKDQIAAYVGRAQSQGTTIGGRVQGSLGLMHKQSTKEGAIKDTDFDITKFGDKGFGFEDIKELSRQGYGKQQIQDYVDHLRTGKVEVPAQQQSVSQSGYDARDPRYGDTGFGQKDIKELMNRGFNKDQIAQFVKEERDKGTPIGQKVAPSLDLLHKQSTKAGQIADTDYSYKDFGDGKGFGFADVQELSKRGYGRQQIRDYIDVLKGQGVTIGQRAVMSADFLQPAKTTTQQTPIGERVQMALDYMDPAKTKIEYRDSEAPFRVDSTYRENLKNIVGNAYKDLVGKRKDYEQSDLGKRYMRYAGEAMT